MIKFTNNKKMLDAKNKAYQILNNHFDIIAFEDRYPLEPIDIFFLAQESAAETVDQILKSIDDRFNGYYTMPEDEKEYYDFFEQVKYEIEISNYDTKRTS